MKFLRKILSNNILHKELSKVYSDIVNRIIIKENIDKRTSISCYWYAWSDNLAWKI